MSFIESLFPKKKDTYQGDPKVRDKMDSLIDSWASAPKGPQPDDLDDLLRKATKDVYKSVKVPDNMMTGLSKSSTAAIQANADASLAAAMASIPTTSSNNLRGAAGAAGATFNGNISTGKVNFPSIKSVPTTPADGSSGDIIYNETSREMLMFDGTKWLPVYASGSNSENKTETIWVHWDTIRESLTNEIKQHRKVMYLDNTKQDIFQRFDEGLLEIDAVESELITLTEVSEEHGIPVELANLLVVVENIAVQKNMRDM